MKKKNGRNDCVFMFVVTCSQTGRELHSDVCARAAQRACESIEQLRGCVTEIECRVFRPHAPVCVGVGESPQ